MKRTLSMLGLVALLAGLASVPQVASADHCDGLLVFTGYNDGSEIPENTTTTGHLNTASFGCNAGAAAHVDTAYILPGATYVRVDALGTAAQAPTGVRIRFNTGAWTNLNLIHNGARFRGPIIAIPAGTQTITAEGTTRETGSPVPHRVVTRQLGA